MIPWTLLGTATVPGNGGTMRFLQRGDEYSIRVDNYELMNSRVHGSEDALASLACARLGNPSKARVLIGGLGMGFTLAAVLKEGVAEAVVAELVPEVVAWNQGPMGAAAGNPLADARSSVRIGDVVDVIREAKSAWDAILLDVDNGPAALTADTNSRLYSQRGLRASFDALRPRGVLGLWSSGPDASFTKRLRQTGFDAEELAVRGGLRNRGPRYVVWIAQK